jgi:hypothetical protein
MPDAHTHARVHRARVPPDVQVHGQVRRVQLRRHPGRARHREGAHGRLLRAGAQRRPRQVAAPPHARRQPRRGHRLPPVLLLRIAVFCTDEDRPTAKEIRCMLAQIKSVRDLL